MPKPSPLPPVDELRDHIHLDAATGRLFWIKNRGKCKLVGKETGVKTNGKKGYRVLVWGNKKYLVHRIVYLMTHSVDPGSYVVDHINGDVSDNRPVNLRLATLKQNSQNMHGPMRNSKTGVLGVHWSSQNKAWCAKLTVDGKQKCRFFKNFDDAAAEIVKLRAQHYGEFAGGSVKCA